MRIEAMEVNTNKKDILKYILKKMPLMSRVLQFNILIKDIHLEYVEIKVLSYEIISKERSIGIFRNKISTYKITMLVNTYNGYSESVNIIPSTISKYVDKSYIKRSKISEEYMVENVKCEIMGFLKNKKSKLEIEKVNLQDINIKEVKSIYKPYWVANFRGKNILIDA
ncbi:hypothetical protein PN290_05695 [Romboutsia sp. 1001216sp1]|uniref:hypothetical protein n=1 Tax=Romboutsia TaxID=1501226 RepID=UPI000B8761E4|nr:MULTISPECIES: hypothetical protein [Romboutsia]MDB8790929.1 hypothetical protein [Romboutsia sp. 1001216sp1]MDB8793657.1 hypothetical protein [Romboutsia sp. 1001216sp1]MDB8795054.1 hypothetical protein [Romboutsia sp. 1001216sp1]MDB8798864.1 hypothetical protein [Romboutsia sp. 1001216sp1]MDB8801667.1 hypothetical protein [Romboutsia sp. 1001216sp1]